MRSRILTTVAELEQFAQQFSSRGNAVSLDYLRYAQVRAFFNAQGTMAAGYARNCYRPLRYEGWIPECHRSSIAVLSSEKKLCELTCIWIAESEGKLSSEKVYLYSVIDALRSGAEYVLGGTLSAVVFGIQTQSLPNLLYSGYTDFFATKKHCWVYGASRGELFRKIMTFFPYNMMMSAMGKPVYLNRARARARQLRMKESRSSAV